MTPAADDEMPDGRSQSEAELKTEKFCRVCKYDIANIHSDICRTCFDNARAALTAHWPRTAGDVSLLVEALEKSNAAMWDAHYGKGITVEYARAVDAEVKAALAKFAGVK